MVDPTKANEVSEKAKEIRTVIENIQQHVIDSSSASVTTTPLSNFVADYYLANRNVLVGDLLIALKANNYPIDWITHKADQIIDTVVFVSLIICSEKQGN